MRCRQPHRAADVGAQVQRRIPRRGGGAGARARAGGIAVEPPGIARDAVQAGDPGGQHAEVRHGGLAEDHAAGLAHPRRGRRVGALQRRLFVGTRADRRRIAARIDVLLDGDRHAVERRQRPPAAPARLRGARLLERAVALHPVHGVDARLPRLDALEKRARHLQRRELAARIGGGSSAALRSWMAAIASRLYTRRRMLRIALAALTLVCCTASAAEIRVWHSMSGVRGAEFDRLVARFNASQKQFRVVATYKGAYDEAVVEATTARRTPRAPHLVQASELGAAFLLEQKDLARPLWQVPANPASRCSGELGGPKTSSTRKAVCSRCRSDARPRCSTTTAMPSASRCSTRRGRRPPGTRWWRRSPPWWSRAAIAR